MKKEELTQKSDKSWESEWKDRALEMALSAVKQFSKNVVDGMHNKVQDIVSSIVRQIFSFALLFFGLIFFLVGVAKLFGDIFGVGDFAGYLFVGAFLVIIASFMHLVRRR